MYAQVVKPKGNESRAVANSVAQKKSGVPQGFGFVDNRPEAIAQRKLQEIANSNPKIQQAVQLPINSDFPIQRIPMEMNESFPAVNEDVSTGEDVFSDTGITSVQVKIGALDEDEDDEVLPLFVGQDYLNTSLSNSYKDDKSKIAGGKPEILWGKDYASILEGHHRTIWSFYHGDAIDFQMAGLASKKNLGEMKYADAPEPKKVEEEEKKE